MLGYLAFQLSRGLALQRSPGLGLQGSGSILGSLVVWDLFETNEFRFKKRQQYQKCYLFVYTSQILGTTPDQEASSEALWPEASMLQN